MSATWLLGGIFLDAVGTRLGLALAVAFWSALNIFTASPARSRGETSAAGEMLYGGFDSAAYRIHAAEWLVAFHNKPPCHALSMSTGAAKPL
jgi:hypothetical protein